MLTPKSSNSIKSRTRNKHEAEMTKQFRILSRSETVLIQLTHSIWRNASLERVRQKVHHETHVKEIMTERLGCYVFKQALRPLTLDKIINF